MEEDEEDIYAPDESGNDNATGLHATQAKQENSNAAQAAVEEEDDEGEEEESDSVCKTTGISFADTDICTQGYRYHHRAPGCRKA